ncbi:hypothetical protein AB0I60_03080 [Actinosynnema sp. NPDC050436]|uniref:SPW repeat domain-containing protein n=1 Tax=Actinosynnema sp. NPDC050436 TaxID=3155659 RepID=UPI0033C953E0
MTPTTPPTRLISWLGTAALALGLWEIAAPIALGHDFGGARALPAAFTGGTVLVVVSLVPAMTPLHARWTAPLVTAAGGWIVAGPWLAGRTNLVFLVNDLAVGGAAVLVGLLLSTLTRPRVVV